MDDADTRLDGRVYAPRVDADIDDEEPEDTPVRDWVLNNKALAFVVVLAGVLVLLAFWMFAKPFFRALNNPYVYGGLVIVGVIAKTWDAGYQASETAERETDTAVLQLSAGAKLYDGEITLGPHNNYIIKPLRKRTRILRRDKPLLVKHVSAEYADVIGSDADPGDRFSIRVSPDLVKHRYHSRHGHVMVAKGDRLESDRTSRDPVVRLARPDTVDKESYQDLHSAFSQLREIVSSLQDENETLRVERSRFKRLWQEGADEAIDRFINREVRLRESESESRGGQPTFRVMSPDDSVTTGDGDE